MSRLIPSASSPLRKLIRLIVPCNVTGYKYVPYMFLLLRSRFLDGMCFMRCATAMARKAKAALQVLFSTTKHMLATLLFPVRS